MDALGVKELKQKQTKVCRDHFFEDDYVSTGSTRLKAYSIPTRNIQKNNPKKSTPKKLDSTDDDSNMSDATLEELKQKVKNTPVTVRLEKNDNTLVHSLRSKTKATNGTNSSSKKRRYSDATDTSEKDSKLTRSANKSRQIREESESPTIELSLTDARPQRKLPTITEAIVTIMNSNPYKYLGLSTEATDLIEIISSNLSISEVNIIITFRKLKLNEDFSLLDDYFRLTDGDAEQIFYYTINVIANYVKHLVTLPCKYNIFEDIPPSYRTTHCQTRLLLSHFSLEIEKSKDFYTNEVTTYGTQHLLHFFYFMTPDGCISYMSPGYGGRLTPDRLLPKCEDVQKILKDESYVITQIPEYDENIHDPTDLSDEQRLAYDLMQKIRQFSIMNGSKPLSANLVPYVDEIATIIAALVNLQTTEAVPSVTT